LPTPPRLPVKYLVYDAYFPLPLECGAIIFTSAEDVFPDSSIDFYVQQVHRIAIRILKI
jgi:hypothetical protein